MKSIISLLLTFYVVFPAAGQVKRVDSWTQGKYVTVHNARLWVVTVGQGDPIILIAGGPGGAHIGLRSFDTLAASGHQLIYYDAFGRGKSDTAKNISEYTLQRDIEDVEGLRKALHLNKISLLGHSYGGVVAQGYALQYPQNVSHLILANTFHSYLMWQANDDNVNREIKTNYPEVWQELMSEREQGYISSDTICQRTYAKVPYGFLYAYNPDRFVHQPGSRIYPNSFNPRLYYQMVGSDGDFIVGNDIGHFDYRRQLRRLSMPVLIIGGRFDRVAVPEMMVKYRTYCPQAKFVMFERSGHNPQVEQPEEEFKVINDFLAK